jgi:hypothetical protein
MENKLCSELSHHAHKIECSEISNDIEAIRIQNQTDDQGVKSFTAIGVRYDKTEIVLGRGGSLDRLLEEVGIKVIEQ